MAVSAPIRSYHVLMSILTIGLIVEKIFAAKNFSQIKTIASTIGTIASDRMTSYQSATKCILSCFQMGEIVTNLWQYKHHALLRCAAIYYDLWRFVGSYCTRSNTTVIREQIPVDTIRCE